MGRSDWRESGVFPSIGNLQHYIWISFLPSSLPLPTLVRLLLNQIENGYISTKTLAGRIFLPQCQEDLKGDAQSY
jgi:hypothetical protein